MSSPRNRRQIVERRDINDHSTGFMVVRDKKMPQDGRLEGSEAPRCPMPVLLGNSADNPIHGRQQIGGQRVKFSLNSSW